MGIYIKVFPTNFFSVTFLCICSRRKCLHNVNLSNMVNSEGHHKYWFQNTLTKLKIEVGLPFFSTQESNTSLAWEMSGSGVCHFQKCPQQSFPMQCIVSVHLCRFDGDEHEDLGGLVLMVNPDVIKSKHGRACLPSLLGEELPSAPKYSFLI